MKVREGSGGTGSVRKILGGSGRVQEGPGGSKRVREGPGGSGRVREGQVGSWRVWQGPKRSRMVRLLQSLVNHIREAFQSKKQQTDLTLQPKLYLCAKVY